MGRKILFLILFGLPLALSAQRDSGRSEVGLSFVNISSPTEMRSNDLLFPLMFFSGGGILYKYSLAPESYLRASLELRQKKTGFPLGTCNDCASGSEQMSSYLGNIGLEYRFGRGIKFKFYSGLDLSFSYTQSSGSFQPGFGPFFSGTKDFRSITRGYGLQPLIGMRQFFSDHLLLFVESSVLVSYQQTQLRETDQITGDEHNTRESALRGKANLIRNLGVAYKF